MCSPCGNKCTVLYVSTRIRFCTSLTANWCGTRRNCTRAYAHLLHQLAGFQNMSHSTESLFYSCEELFFKIGTRAIRCKTVLQSLRYPAGNVGAVVDGDKIRDYRFFVIDVTFKVKPDKESEWTNLQSLSQYICTCYAV